MATKKKKDDDEKFVSEELVQPPDKPTGPVPGTVYVKNLTKVDLDIPLTDGTSLGPLGPKGSANDTSRRVIPKKLLPQAVRRMEQKRMVRLIPAAEGGK